MVSNDGNQASTSLPYISGLVIRPNAMNVRQSITIAVVALFMIGGMAAIGAASPAGQASDNASDAHHENASTDGGATDAADRAGSPDNVGPADGLPAQVPDHVSELHDRIESFLNGSIDHLGQTLSDLLDDTDRPEPGNNSETDDESDDADPAT